MGVCNYTRNPIKSSSSFFLFIPPFESSLSIRSINANDLDVEQQGSIDARIFQHKIEGSHTFSGKTNARVKSNEVKDDDVEVAAPEHTASDIAHT